jgi:hypothetical protein
MKMRFPKYPILALLISVCLPVSGLRSQDSTIPKAEPAADSPVGVWRGESICTTGNPSCHDEKVVYYIKAIADKPDSMFIQADKIVDGKAITMGAGEWQYHRARHTLSWQSEERLWLLTIDHKRIEGTLTLPGNVVFRRMTLKKDD